MSALDRALTIDDLKKLARRRVPKQFFDYIDSGAFTEGTYRANEDDFKKITFRQRVAVNLEDRTLSSTLLGQPVSLPVAIAPVGSTGMTDADGEIKAARAAEKFGIPFTLSTMAICSIEDVAENTTKPFWFQLYVMKDRAYIERLIDRAKAAKCSALVLTMDLQILGQRHKDVRNGLTAPPKITPRFVAEMMVKPGWGLRMLGTNAPHLPQHCRPRRRTRSTSRSLSEMEPSERQFDLDAQLERHRAGSRSASAARTLDPPSEGRPRSRGRLHNSLID